MFLLMLIAADGTANLFEAMNRYGWNWQQKNLQGFRSI